MYGRTGKNGNIPCSEITTPQTCSASSSPPRTPLRRTALRTHKDTEQTARRKRATESIAERRAPAASSPGRELLRAGAERRTRRRSEPHGGRAAPGRPLLPPGGARSAQAASRAPARPRGKPRRGPAPGAHSPRRGSHCGSAARAPRKEGGSRRRPESPRPCGRRLPPAAAAPPRPRRGRRLPAQGRAPPPRRQGRDRAAPRWPPPSRRPLPRRRRWAGGGRAGRGPRRGGGQREPRRRRKEAPRGAALQLLHCYRDLRAGAVSTPITFSLLQSSYRY